MTSAQAALSSVPEHGYRRRTAFAGFVLTLPAIVFLGVFFAIPLVTLLLTSVEDGTLRSYREIIDSALYLNSFLISARISAFVVLIDLMLAYPLAYYLTIATPRARAVGIFLVLLPFWSSQLIRAFAWLVLFGRRGIVNDTLISVGLINQPLNLLYTETAVLVGSAYVMLPFMVFPLYSAMRRIDLNLVVAAQGLGASGLQAFLKVYWPLSLNGVVAGVVLVFVVTLGSYTNAAVLGGGKVMMIALSIKQNVSVLLDFQMASALSIVLLVVTIALYSIFARAVKGRTGVGDPL